MLHYLRTYLLVLLAVTIYSVSLAQQRVEGSLLVMLKPNAEMAKLQQELAGTPDVELVSVKLLSNNMRIWQVQVADADTDEALRYLLRSPLVELAQYEHTAQPRSIPNDTLFSQQWALNNTGQTGGVPDADIDAAEAWDLTTSGVTSNGDTIVVAIIDRGIDLNHIDLDFWVNNDEIRGDGIDNDNNGYVDDYRGWYVPAANDTLPGGTHGTHVAGVAGAKGNNITLVSGVAPSIKLMPVMVSTYNESQVVEAYTYIMEQRRAYNQSNGAEGAYVVATNSSFGVDFGDPANYPIWCAMYDSMGSVGILSAAATSNIGHDIDANGDVPSLCTSDFLVTVTNTTLTDYHNASSGFGITSIDMGAPGTGIISTYPGNSYHTLTGTSMASPHVAGAIAMLYAYACDSLIAESLTDPASAASKMKLALMNSTDTINTLVGKTVTSGRLNVYQAMLQMYNTECVTCISLDLLVTDVTCHDDSNGTIVAVASGMPPYSYLWNNGDTTTSISGLKGGRYQITVTDSVNCVKYAYIDVANPDELLTGYTITRSSNGLPDGAAQANILGGVAPYSFNWSNGDTAGVANSLLPGEYTVTVTDANGCAVWDTITVRIDSTISAVGPDLELLDVKLYPNPATDKLQVSLGQLPDAADLRIIDLSGRVVLQTSLTEANSVIDLSDLNTGMYLVQVNAGEKRSRYLKLMKL